MAPSLAEISKISDEKIVQIWLSERGLVAVERSVMERLASLLIGAGNIAPRVLYDSQQDRYVEWQPSRHRTAA